MYAPFLTWFTNLATLIITNNIFFPKLYYTNYYKSEKNRFTRVSLLTENPDPVFLPDPGRRPKKPIPDPQHCQPVGME